MGEEEYWQQLELRICREFQGMPEEHLRFLWCDGLTPEHYQLAGPAPHIAGHAWIGSAPDEEQWKFTLFLKQPAPSRSEIDWSSLLPPGNRSRWLTVDVPGKRIQITPSSATSDPPSS